MSDFKPCPFCGGTNIRSDEDVFGRRTRDHGPNETVYSMWCYNCGATFPNCFSRESLVASWNKRVDQTPKCEPNPTPSAEPVRYYHKNSGIDADLYKREQIQAFPSKYEPIYASPAPGLIDAIANIESRFFRTETDTGAQEHARLILNAFRKIAGLPRITTQDLPKWDGHKYAMPQDSKLLANTQATIANCEDNL